MFPVIEFTVIGLEDRNSIFLLTILSNFQRQEMLRFLVISVKFDPNNAMQQVLKQPSIFKTWWWMRLRKTTLVSKITFLKKKQTKACQNRNFKGLKRGSSGSFVAKSCRQLSTRHLKRYLSQGTKGRNFVHLPKKKNKRKKEREEMNWRN